MTILRVACIATAAGPLPSPVAVQYRLLKFAAPDWFKATHSQWVAGYCALSLPVPRCASPAILNALRYSLSRRVSPVYLFL